MENNVNNKCWNEENNNKNLDSSRECSTNVTDEGISQEKGLAYSLDCSLQLLVVWLMVWRVDNKDGGRRGQPNPTSLKWYNSTQKIWAVIYR